MPCNWTLLPFSYVNNNKVHVHHWQIDYCYCHTLSWDRFLHMIPCDYSIYQRLIVKVTNKALRSLYVRGVLFVAPHHCIPFCNYTEKFCMFCMSKPMSGVGAKKASETEKQQRM